MKTILKLCVAVMLLSCLAVSCIDIDNYHYECECNHGGTGSGTSSGTATIEFGVGDIETGN